MALQPARGLASSLRGMGTWTSLMGTNGPLSSIIQKSGSRRGIVLLATGDPACGPDAGHCDYGRTTEGFPGLADFREGDRFLNPASMLLCKHALKPPHTPATSVHTSHHCTRTLHTNPPSL